MVTDIHKLGGLHSSLGISCALNPCRVRWLRRSNFTQVLESTSHHLKDNILSLRQTRSEHAPSIGMNEVYSVQDGCARSKMADN